MMSWDSQKTHLHWLTWESVPPTMAPIVEARHHVLTCFRIRTERKWEREAYIWYNPLKSPQSLSGTRSVAEVVNIPAPPRPCMARMKEISNGRLIRDWNSLWPVISIAILVAAPHNTQPKENIVIETSVTNLCPNACIYQDHQQTPWKVNKIYLGKGTCSRHQSSASNTVSGSYPNIGVTTMQCVDNCGESIQHDQGGGGNKIPDRGGVLTLNAIPNFLI